MKLNRTFLRPLGSGIAMSVPLVTGILVKDPQICSMGTMGAFAYLAFQHLSIGYNLKAILLHGGAIWGAFLFGALSALTPWVAPFVIALFACIAFVVAKVFRIPKPNYFFVIMLYATGYNFQADSISGIFTHSTYLLYGIGGSLVAGLLISYLEQLPLRVPKDRFQKLMVKDKYYLTLYQQPEVLIKALHFAMVLFVAAYIAYLLRASNGYWVLISAAAVLAGEDMDNIKKRTVGRVIGGIIGIGIGFLLMRLELPLESKAAILVVLNILTEYCMPINYLVANFFTNPQVLLLMTIGNSFTPLHLIPMRFSGALIGSLLAMVLIFVMEYALAQVRPETVFDHGK